jgi:hypothetical protein
VDALLGIFLSTRLPEHHRTGGSKDVVIMGMGLIGTMTALVLGLLVASAQEFLFLVFNLRSWSQ